MQITILFEAPFYVAIIEQEYDGQYFAARHVFGPAPSNEQVYAFVQEQLIGVLNRMTVGIKAEAQRPTHKNPKRIQREVRRQMAVQGPTNKSHEAMRHAYETNKRERKQDRKAERDALRTYKRQRKVEKARKKRKGH